MKIAIIGAGTVGSHYAVRWLAAGHEVVLSYSRDPAVLAARAAHMGACSAVPAAATDGADLVVFSPPFEQVADAAAQAGSLDGMIVVDTTNPFTPDRSGLVDLPDGMAAFDVVRSALPGARLVKALHNLAIAQLAHAGVDRPVAFVASDDAQAREVVSHVIADAGLTPFDTGRLETARLSEAPGPLFMHIYTAQRAREALARLVGEATIQP